MHHCCQFITGRGVVKLGRQLTRYPGYFRSMSEYALAKGQACPSLQPGTLRLYSMRFCPYAQSTRLVLAHKGIKFETVNVNLRRKPEWLFQLNPVGFVPIIQCDDQVLYESAVCNDYLDEVYPQHKLNPDGTYLKAKDRQLWETMHKLTSSFYAVGFSAGQNSKALARLLRAFSRYDKELKSRRGPFFGGDKVCMVDFMLWPWFERVPFLNKLIPETTVTADKYPMLSNWVEQMSDLPAVKETILDMDSHTHFLVGLGNGTQDYDYGLVEHARL